MNLTNGLESMLKLISTLLGKPILLELTERRGNSLVVQWLGLHTFPPKVLGSISGQLRSHKPPGAGVRGGRKEPATEPRRGRDKTAQCATTGLGVYENSLCSF